MDMAKLRYLREREVALMSHRADLSSRWMEAVEDEKRKELEYRIDRINDELARITPALKRERRQVV